MLNIHNLSVSFAGEFLFEQITYKISAGDRIGLVGKNGAGKSTMLKVLSGELSPDTGQLAIEKSIKMGFLKQDIDFVQGRTVLEEAYEAFEEIKSLERKMEQINLELASRTDYESDDYTELIQNVSDATQHYQIIGGYNYKADTEKILLGLGFKPDDFNRLTDTFSGGWRMRIELAKLLLQSNDILLLDEPTNHLDIESIIWLEHFLKSYSGAVVIVSHDKMFLDEVTNRTIEISLGKIYDYNKPYSKYLVLREELRVQQLASQKNQAKQIEHTEKLIEKFRSKATKASMAQSLIKKLDKVERIVVDSEDTAVMGIEFPVSVQPGKVVLELEKVGKSYGEKTILKDVNLLVERGVKVAFVGQNGQGKSTLAKLIVDEIQGTGAIKKGHNVQIGYFAQNQAEYLDGEKTLLDTMIDAANATTRPKVRDLLGAFLFQGDDVEKKVKVLSGGERNRLALCKMLLQPFNVLIMDEPTNHLDIKSKNVLKAALAKFEGTLLLVSHDRDFLQGLTDKIYEFRDQKIKEYLGDIDYYLQERQMENMREVEKSSKSIEKKGVSSASSVKANAIDKSNKKNDFETQKKIKALQNKVSNTESKISKLENEIEKMDLQLAENYEEMSTDPEFFSIYEQKKKKVSDLLSTWENLQEELEEYVN